MREIKFRAWDTTKNKMFYGDNVVAYGDDTFAIFYESNNPCTGCAYLMQFTGLLDKNGNEIFEGDIVKSVVNYNDDGQGIFLICFYNGIFFAKRCFDDDGEANYQLSDAEYYFDEGRFINESPSLFELIQEDEIIEVVGNIYQNPELLTTP